MERRDGGGDQEAQTAGKIYKPGAREGLSLHEIGHFTAPCSNNQGETGAARRDFLSRRAS